MRQRIVTLCLLVLTFMAGSYVTYLVLDARNTNIEVPGYREKIIIDESGISEAVEKIYDAVVLIESYRGVQVVSTGTGFVYKTDNKYGYIITNEHVVANATSKVEVTFYNGDKVEAKVLGGDVFADIAVLSVDVKKVKKVAELGDSRKIKLGDTVFTVGTPVSTEYMGTVTRGVISGVNRMVAVSVSGVQDDWIMEVIQTDAAINPGNSGGPLVNINGQVIGINSLKFVKQEIEGMGFAIPIDIAMAHINKLEKGEKIERPLLGVEFLDVSDTWNLYKAGITVDESIKQGAVVVRILSDTPASVAGLKKGDVVVKIGDVNLKNQAYLRYSLYKYDIGDTVTISYYRGKELKTVNVKLDKVYNEGT
jgi:serine protease Do